MEILLRDYRALEREQLRETIKLLSWNSGKKIVFRKYRGPMSAIPESEWLKTPEKTSDDLMRFEGVCDCMRSGELD